MDSAHRRPIPEMIKSRVAYTVCGPSISRALREGAKHDVMAFFNHLDLSPLSNCSKKKFETWLNDTTYRLEDRLACFIEKP